ncbi:MAG: ABC transporter ATP-binding protein [Oscillospiraceae bacterium]|jgi:ABC-2 type transport system ATP-binding protein|nr:ABC transporter ATP-binding protein [Oscillospiraceae bacterium]
MIIAENLTKKFDDTLALNNLNCKINEGCIYGLVGANGAGKSTFLRLLAGVYKPDSGTITVDGESTYENTAVKAQMVYVPDELYFVAGANMKQMAALYASAYPNFDYGRLNELAEAFGLSLKKPINTFSKGMKRQAATVLALAAKPRILFFDETFDGLDPIVRNTVKKIICADVVDRKSTTIITTHSLRELEDTCDQLGLMYNGGIVFESDISDVKTALSKVQIAFSSEVSRESIEAVLGAESIRSYTNKGSVSNLIVSGDKKEVVQKLNSLSPILLDILPLSLEEFFVYEMNSLGYNFDDVFAKELAENGK